MSIMAPSQGPGPYAQNIAALAAYNGASLARVKEASGDFVGPGGSKQSNVSEQKSQSGSYWNNPGLIEALSQSLAGPINRSSMDYNDFIRNPAGNPAYQSALYGGLQSLIPAEREGDRALSDAFRAAGMNNSSTHASALVDRATQKERNQQIYASQLLTSLYPQMAQAMFAPLSQTDALINSLKQQQSTSSGSSSGSGTSQSYPPSGGGGGGGGGSMGPIGGAFTPPPGGGGGWTNPSPNQYFAGPSSQWTSSGGGLMDSLGGGYGGGVADYGGGFNDAVGGSYDPGTGFDWGYDSQANNPYDFGGGQTDFY